jgi:hypothetical protein
MYSHLTVHYTVEGPSALEVYSTGTRVCVPAPPGVFLPVLEAASDTIFCPSY